MIVYLAWVWDYMECQSLIGVYDSHEKAEQAAKNWIADYVEKHTQLFTSFNMATPDWDFKYRVEPKEVQ